MGQGSGSTSITINSYGGWQGVLNFTCSNLPAYATCSPYPGAPIVNFSPTTSGVAVAPTTVLFIINTNVPPIVPKASGFIWWISGFSGLALIVARRRLRGLGLGGLNLAASAFLLIASIGAMSGCSNTTYTTVTPVGTSNVLVTMSAAQGVPGSTNGSVQLPDSNVGSFTISLNVK